MSISTIRRQVKNVAYNFSDAQVKVREATSNDPWGPSTALMSEIADMTHNPMSFAEIMSMLWKRLNDHGKNWRHVYKALVLLDYLIKCGSDKVAQQCRENIYSIETLKDFQHVEDNRDQAKQMVVLLYDEERLKNERTRFQMTRKRFENNGLAIGSDGSTRSMRKSDTTGAALSADLEQARPSSAGEEEMQLQIALALSREENQKEEEMRKGDDVRLQMAISESRRDVERVHSVDSILAPKPQTINGSQLSQSAIDDLLSLGVGTLAEPMPTRSAGSSGGPWGGPVADPWNPAPPQSVPIAFQQQTVDPWAPVISPQHPVALASQNNGSVYPSLSSTTNGRDPWAPSNSSTTNELAFGGGLPIMQPTLPTMEENVNKQRNAVKTPETFLGENSSLVNLENLMGTTTGNSSMNKPANNPFLGGGMMSSSFSQQQPTNPFAAQQRPSPTLNEMMMRAQQNEARLPQPLQPTSTASVTNPFMSS